MDLSEAALDAMSLSTASDSSCSSLTASLTTPTPRSPSRPASDLILKIEKEMDEMQLNSKETLFEISKVLDKSSATTVATTQTLREFAQELGDASDHAVKRAYSAMAIMEEIDRKMIIVYNARKRMKQISALLDVLEEKVDAC